MPRVTVKGTSESVQAEVAAIVARVYDILEDDKCIRALLRMAEGERGEYFDRLRKEYPRRREFHNTDATVLPLNTAMVNMLRGLGFKV